MTMTMKAEIDAMHEKNSKQRKRSNNEFLYGIKIAINLVKITRKPKRD